MGGMRHREEAPVNNEVLFISINSRYYLIDSYHLTFHDKQNFLMELRGVMKNRALVAIVSAAILAGCQTAAQHRADVDEAMQNSGSNRLTLGLVQSQIKKGMSGGDVATVMGSPNIVSTDPNGNEVWIYDKIATDKAYSESNSGVNVGGGGGGFVGSGILGGTASVGGSSSAGASSTSQRTLTVVIKFNDKKMVRDVAYHTSRF